MPKKRTKEEAIEVINRNKHDDITIDPDIVEYVNDKTKIKVICKKHGIIEMTPKSLVSGHMCYRCSQSLNASKQKTNNLEYVVSYIRQKFPEIVIPNDKINYVNNHTKFTLMCKKHGEFETSFNRLTNSKCACEKCSYELRQQNSKKNIDIFKEELHRVNANVSLCDDSVYINNKTPIKVCCDKHGVFSMSPQDLLNGHGCPICGEQFAAHERMLLENLKKKYPFTEIVHRYKDKNVLGKKEIDIYFPKYKIGIEYQGIEHFKPVKHFGGYERFYELIERDKEKIQNCDDNDIKLFHFTYSKKNKRIHDNNKLVDYELITDESELFDIIDKYTDSIKKIT